MDVGPEPARRDEARLAVERGDTPGWMVTDLTNLLGVAVTKVYWGDTVETHVSPFRVGNALADIIAAYED